MFSCIALPALRSCVVAALACLIGQPAPAGAQVTLRGVVVDASSGQPVPAALVRLLPVGQSVFTDVDGRFVLSKVPIEAQGVRVVALGFAPAEVVLRAMVDPAASLNIQLTPRVTELAGITVIGQGPGALSRLPGSAAVIDAAELQATRPLSGNEVLKLMPGVHVQEEEGLGFRANIGIRGLDPDRSRTVLVLEDGIPVALAPYGEPEMYYTPPIDRMERVELIKGSGSIQFGPQTIGGVLNYVTADPPETPGGRLELMGGSGEFAMGQLAYGGTWNGAGLRLNALRRQAQDIRGVWFNQTDVGAKFSLPVGERNLVGAKIGVYDEASNSTYVGLTDSIFRVNPHSYPGADDLLRIRRYSVSLSHERRFGSGVGLRTAAYAYQTVRNWSRQDYAYSPGGNGFVFANSTGNRDRAFEVAGIEPRLRVVHHLGEFEAGVRAHYERVRDQHIDGRTATSRTGQIRDDEVRHGYALAAFAQNRFEVSERLRVTPGLRFEYFIYDRNILRMRLRREVRDTSGTLIGTTRLPEDVDLRSGDRMVALIPGLGLNWYPASGATLFVGAHRGFAPPRVKDALIYGDDLLSPSQQPGDPVSLQLDAEQSWNFEVGARLRFAGAVSFDATAFYLDFSNQIVEPSLSAGSVAQAQLANQGATRHRGVETAVGVDWAVLAGWPFSLMTELKHTYADARFSRDRYLRHLDGDTVNIRGNRLPYAPEQRWVLSGTLSLPAGLTLKVDGIRVSEQFADNFETRDPSPTGRNGLIPSYLAWNAAASHRVPGTSLTWVATVKNVFDELYIASRRPEGIKPGLLRQVHLGVEWSF